MSERGREMTWQEAEELNTQVAAVLEPMPGPISAREAREQKRDFVWANEVRHYSPKRFWFANIGSDHGPPEDDDKPVQWRPGHEFCEDIAAAWLVVDWVRTHGTVEQRAVFSHRLPQIVQKRYLLPERADWILQLQPVDICNAVLEALAGNAAALAAGERGG